MSKTQEALKLAQTLEEESQDSPDDYRWQAAQFIREALAEQPAQQQEPVAWITQNGKGWLRWHKPEDNNTDSVPLYTSPPASKPWVGLTDEEIMEISDATEGSDCWHIDFARAIEAKLREKNA